MPPTARASWRRAPSTHRRGRGGRGGVRAAPTPRLTTSSPSPAARRGRGRGRGAGAAGRGACAPPDKQLLYSTILDETLFCKSEDATPPAECRRRPGAAAWCAACWRHGAPHPAPHRCPYQDCLGCWMCAEGSPYPRLLQQHGVDRLCGVRLQRLVAPTPSPAQPTPAPVNTGRKRFRMRLEPRPEEQDPVQDYVNGAADTTSSHGDTDFAPYEIHDGPGQNQHDTFSWDYTEQEPDKQDDVHEERQSTPLEPLTVETDLEQVSKPAVEAALCALESPLPPKPKAARVLGPVKVRRRSGERDPPYLSWMCAPLGQRAWAGTGPRAWAGAWAGPKSISVTPHGVYVVFKSKRSSSGPSLRRSRPFTAGKPSPKSIRGSPIKAEPMSPPRGDRSPSKSVVKVETGTRRSALLHRRRLEVFSFSADDDLEEDGPPARECVRPQPRCVRCHVHGQGLLVRRHKPDRCPNRRCTCENCSEFKFERPSRGRARRAKAERKAADKASAGQVAAQEARPGGGELQQVAAATQTQFNPLPTGIDTKDMLPQEPAFDTGAAVEANLRTGAALTTSEAVAEQVTTPTCAILAEEDAADARAFGPATMVDAAAGGSPPSGDDDDEEDGEPLEDCMVAYMCTDDDALEVEAFGCAWCGREFPTEEEAERHALRHAEDDVDVDEMEIKEEVEEKYEDVAVWDACAGLSVFSPSPPGSPSATIKSSPGTPPSSTPTTAATRSPALTSPAATRTPTRTSPASTGTPAPTSPAANRTPTPTSPAATRTPAPTSPSATRDPAPTSPAATSAPVARPAAKVTPPTSPPATRSLLPASAVSEAPPSAGPTSAAAKSSSKAVVAVAAVGVRPAAGARPVVRTDRQPPVVFKCLDCHDEFGSRVELARHRLGRHSHEQWYRCATCDSSFHTERMRAVHMAVMHPARVFACEACPARLLSRLAVQLHMLDAHGAAPEDGLHCQCCPHRLFSAQHLFDHVRDLHRGRCFPCACPTCGQSAPDVRTMLEHEGSHVDELRRLYCKFCSTWFPTLELLDGHVSVTHPGRRHACAPCGLAFPSAALADKHARDAHRGRHLYACACGAAFDAPSELYRHATETLHMMEVKDASKFHDDLVPRRANTSGLKMLPMDRMAQLLTLVKDVGCLSPRLPNTPPPLPGGGAQTKQPAAQQPLAPRPAPPSTQPPAEARFVARPLGPSKPRILSKSGPKPPQCRLPTQLPARPSLLSPDARPLQSRPQLRPSQHPTLRLDPQPFPGAGPLPPSPPRADLLSPPRVGLLSLPRASPQPPLRADPPSPPRADLLSAPRVAPQHPPRVAPQPPLRADPPSPPRADLLSALRVAPQHPPRVAPQPTLRANLLAAPRAYLLSPPPANPRLVLARPPPQPASQPRPVPRPSTHHALPRLETVRRVESVPEHIVMKQRAMMSQRRERALEPRALPRKRPQRLAKGPRPQTEAAGTREAAPPQQIVVTPDLELGLPPEPRALRPLAAAPGPTPDPADSPSPLLASIKLDQLLRRQRIQPQQLHLRRGLATVKPVRTRASRGATTTATVTAADRGRGRGSGRGRGATSWHIRGHNRTL